MKKQGMFVAVGLQVRLESKERQIVVGAEDATFRDWSQDIIPLWEVGLCCSCPFHKFSGLYSDL